MRTAHRFDKRPRSIAGAGGEVEVLEGDWRPSRLVIVEFPSIEAARAWYSSPDYERIKEIRLARADSELVLTDAGALPI